MDFSEEQLATLLEYAGRAISREEAARRLGVSQRHINRYLHLVQLDRTTSPSSIDRTEAAKRRMAREQAALAVSRGHITEKQAAKRAGCSERTIYRYLERLK